MLKDEDSICSDEAASPLQQPLSSGMHMARSSASMDLSGSYLLDALLGHAVLLHECHNRLHVMLNAKRPGLQYTACILRSNYRSDVHIDTRAGLTGNFRHAGK